MWWNKKEVKEEIKPKEPETTVLYKRIKRLYNIIEEVNFDGVYQSKLGKRQIKITKNYDGYTFCFNDMTKIKTHKNPFGNYVKVPKNIFNLYVRECVTTLEPCPINLSAHEINLAILEFENYIEKIYNEHTAKIKELGG